MKTTENFIDRLHFIISPHKGQCARSGVPIERGATCIERISSTGEREWYAAGSETFSWWVRKHTKITLNQALRGLCNHGLIAACDQCREITPGWEKPAPIKDRKLWDDNGNYCRITMHNIGAEMFELWLHRFNDATPDRFVGTLGDCMARGEAWIAHQKSEGFHHEDLPSYSNPTPKN